MRAHPNVALSFVVLACLLPFLGKPVHMDDPLFVWTARHISDHPTDPYGSQVNWYGTPSPMSQGTQNPPLAAYYLAIAASLLGWSERALHAALILPALAVILGTLRLARHFCQRPMLAALIALFTPTFLVSATTLMCDVLLLTFWVWAIVFWIEGLDDQKGESGWRLCAAAVFMVLAFLTKYFGAMLIPLLVAYGLIKKRRLGSWAAWLLVPVAVILAYDWAMRALYGRTLLLAAAEYARWPSGFFPLLNAKLGTTLIALTFTGGGLALVTLTSPFFLSKKMFLLISGTTAVAAVALFATGAVLKDYGPIIGSTRLAVQGQMVFWAIGGSALLAWVWTELRSRRGALSWLLGLWVFGTFVFAALINWTVNGRSLLPMAPAVGILVARRLEMNVLVSEWKRRAVWLGMLAGASLALLVTRADYLLARAVRESARQICHKFRDERSLWFQGHWGFQFYMEDYGATALDVLNTNLKPGDHVVAPANNTNFLPLNPELVSLREEIFVAGPSLLATMKGEIGAGFYASLRGPLPFAFGAVPPEWVVVLRVERVPARAE